MFANVSCMINWVLRGNSYRNTLNYWARQNVENNTTAPINYIHC